MASLNSACSSTSAGYMSPDRTRECLMKLLGPYQIRPVGQSFCRVCGGSGQVPSSLQGPINLGYHETTKLREDNKKMLGELMEAELKYSTPIRFSLSQEMICKSQTIPESQEVSGIKESNVSPSDEELCALDDKFKPTIAVGEVDTSEIGPSKGKVNNKQKMEPERRKTKSTGKMITTVQGVSGTPATKGTQNASIKEKKTCKGKKVLGKNKKVLDHEMVSHKGEMALCKKKTLDKEKKVPDSEKKTPGREKKASVKEKKTSDKEEKAPVNKEKALGRKEKASDKEKKALGKEKKASDKEKKALGKEKKASDKEKKALGKKKKASDKASGKEEKVSGKEKEVSNKQKPRQRKPEVIVRTIRDGKEFEYVKEPTECSICLQLLRIPHKTLCCGTNLCHQCASRLSACGQFECPACGSKKFKSVVENKELRHTLLRTKVAISMAMDEYRVSSEHIPSTLFPDTFDELYGSLRYFYLSASSEFTCKLLCKQRWKSKRGHCVLDLKEQCIIYSSPRKCLRCGTPCRPRFDINAVIYLAKRATVFHQIHSLKIPNCHREHFHLRHLDNVIILLLTGGLKSARYIQWQHHTNHTMYGHNYWLTARWLRQRY